MIDAGRLSDRQLSIVDRRSRAPPRYPTNRDTPSPAIALDRRPGGVDIEDERVALLPFRRRSRRKPIAPAKLIPVVNVMAERDDRGARNRLLVDEPLKERIGRGTARAALRREQLDENRRRRSGGD